MTYITRVHVAGEPIGAIQRCSRCGVILINAEGTMMLEGQSFAWWAAGAFIGVTERVDGIKVNPVMYAALDHDAREIDEIHCNSGKQ